MPCTWQINTSVQLDAKQKTLKIKNKKVGYHAHGKQMHWSNVGYTNPKPEKYKLKMSDAMHMENRYIRIYIFKVLGFGRTNPKP